MDPDQVVENASTSGTAESGAPPVGRARSGSVASRTFKLLLLSLVIILTAAFVPTPYTLKAPGRADDLASMVKVGVGHQAYPGKLLMTTVIYERASLFFCLYAALDPHAELVTRETRPIRIAHPSVSLPLVVGTSQMDASKLTAKVAALRYVGYKVKLESSGVRILSILEISKAGQFLKPADVLLAMDGSPINNYNDLRKALESHQAGDVVRLKVSREGKVLEGNVSTIEADRRTMLGVSVADDFDNSPLPVPITINSKSIQGGSAGLMFALEIVRQLKDEDITRGHVVAGTGTIDDRGAVGPIEGVRQKLEASRRAGAEVFLVPYDNRLDIPKTDSSMRIVPVRTLDEAMRALDRLPLR